MDVCLALPVLTIMLSQERLKTKKYMVDYTMPDMGQRVPSPPPLKKKKFSHS